MLHEQRSVCPVVERLRWRDRSPGGETAVDRFLGTGVGLKASAKKDEVSFRRQVAEQFCFALQFADIRRRLTEDD